MSTRESKRWHRGCLVNGMRFVFPLIVGLLLFVRQNSPAEALSTTPARASSGAVIREMNMARQHPDVYAGYLEGLRSHFRGDLLRLPAGTMIRTHEGLGALEEAIRFLRRARPIAPLNFSPGISLAAAEHVADQANGRMGHAGSDRSTMAERMNRHGIWSACCGENIAYGRSNARDIVMALIIDDGLRGRKHRKNIFNPTFNYAGAAIGRHARYGTVCSIDFAGGYTERNRTNDQLFARN